MNIIMQNANYSLSQICSDMCGIVIKSSKMVSNDIPTDAVIFIVDDKINNTFSDSIKNQHKWIFSMYGSYNNNIGTVMISYYFMIQAESYENAERKFFTLVNSNTFYDYNKRIKLNLDYDIRMTIESDEIYNQIEQRKELGRILSELIPYT